MFSGIGGFEVAIRSAVPEAKCIGYSEIDEHAIKTYERQFNGHTNYGDATGINSADLPDFDLLVGGFPCQAFSVAGNRGGFNDTRGTLFFDVARILKDKRPPYLVLENVKGLLSHDGGKTFQVILGVLTELGYHVEWKILNSKYFGVPQNRERIYIVGHLGGFSGRKVFPFPTDDKTLEEIWNQNNHSRRNSSDHQSTDGGATERREVSQALDANYFKGIDNHGQRTAVIQRPRGKNNSGIHELSPAVTGNSFDQNNHLQHQERYRRFTPLECERLQAFPDDWTAGVSDTQRYRQCGNAITTRVAQAVIEGLIK
jgi:DNA (cytosine-5)-methyltransferase 1